MLRTYTAYFCFSCLMYFLQLLSAQAEFDTNVPYVGPYHYGSHYSNSGTVLHYLIRLLPYTYGFIKYQGNSYIFKCRLNFI